MFGAELKACFGINVDMDQEDIHPPSICILCHKLVSRYQEAIAAGRDLSPRHGGYGVIKEWTAHSEIS